MLHLVPTKKNRNRGAPKRPNSTARPSFKTRSGALSLSLCTMPVCLPKRMNLRQAVIEIVSEHGLHDAAGAAWTARSRSQLMQDKHNEKRPQQRSLLHREVYSWTRPLTPTTLPRWRSLLMQDPDIGLSDTAGLGFQTKVFEPRFAGRYGSRTEITKRSYHRSQRHGQGELPTSCLLKGMDEVAVCGTREQVGALKTLRQAVEGEQARSKRALLSCTNGLDRNRCRGKSLRWAARLQVEEVRRRGRAASTTHVVGGDGDNTGGHVGQRQNAHASSDQERPCTLRSKCSARSSSVWEHGSCLSVLAKTEKVNVATLMAMSNGVPCRRS